jgi:23S rRNA (pseudouridine1915-N3)-methyltransferase
LKISLILVGRTEEQWLREGTAVYSQRIKHYLPFQEVELPAIKNPKNYSQEQQKEKEGELILKAAEATDHFFLLDEGGKEFDSVQFSSFLQKEMNQGIKHLAFVVGGAFGFSNSVQTRARGKISLSKMTFTHQMVRLFYTEQLYRALTILKGEKYHHS